MTEELSENTEIDDAIDEPQLSDAEYAEPDEQDSEQPQLETEDSPELDIEEQTLNEEKIDSPPSSPDVDLTVESVVEAVLFASDEPLTAARLANIVEVTTKQIREHIDNLNNKYQAGNHAFRIEQIAGGYQMLTLSNYNHWLKQLLRVRSETKLSPAALETLAIIAYKQPVIRADIEAIRGVAVGEVIRSLCYKGLIKIVGRAEVLGRPMLYGTTKKFLEVFGLNTLKDLPKIEELKKPPN
jgi:segregation and condensation protein B